MKSWLTDLLDSYDFTLKYVFGVIRCPFIHAQYLSMPRKHHEMVIRTYWYRCHFSKRNNARWLVNNSRNWREFVMKPELLQNRYFGIIKLFVVHNDKYVTYWMCCKHCKCWSADNEISYIEDITSKKNIYKLFLYIYVKTVFKETGL